MSRYAGVESMTVRKLPQRFDEVSSEIYLALCLIEMKSMKVRDRTPKQRNF